MPRPERPLDPSAGRSHDRPAAVVVGDARRRDHPALGERTWRPERCRASTGFLHAALVGAIPALLPRNLCEDTRLPYILRDAMTVSAAAFTDFLVMSGARSAR